MQKFKLPLIIGGILSVIIAVYFLFVRQAGVYEAVPASAIAAVEVTDWNQLNNRLNTTTSGAALYKAAAVQKLMREIALLQELVSANKLLVQSIASQNTVASLHLTSATDYDFLFTSSLNGVNDNALLNQIQTSAKTGSVSVHIFKNQKIIDVHFKDGQVLSFAKKGNILALSFTTFLTENAMAALSSGDNLAADKGFKTVSQKLSSKGDLNLYFNFQKADVIFPVAFKAEKIALLQDITTAGGWGRYEVSLGNDRIDLDGTISLLTEVKENTHNILTENLLANIPDHAAYVQLSHSDTTGGTILNKFFDGWIGNTKAFVILEPLKENFNEQNVFLLSVKNQSVALENLKSLTTNIGTAPEPVDTFLTQPIYNLPDGSVINQIFGNKLVTFKNCFYTVSANAAIFCNNKDVLKLLLEKVSKGESVDKDDAFVNTGFSHYGMNSTLQYMNLQRSDLLVNGLLKESSTVAPLLSSFKNVLSISNANGKKTFSHLTFYNGGQGKSASGLVWKTKLKTATNYTPQMVLNSTTNEKEVFVQDTANNIYLISQSGEILFTKNIGAPIVGSVQQLDYYNNGKLQYIFNSPQHVFIIDRLGNDVGSYPLRLSAIATAGITLVKTGAINRYYVPCANGSIYGYEGNGKPLAGFSPRSGVGVLNNPVQHIHSGKNDLLLCFNNAGRLLLLDSRGTLKWSIDNLPAASQDFSAVVLANDFKLLNASGNQLTEIAADGNDKILPLIDSANAFTAITTSDTAYSYYYSTKGQLRAYNAANEFKASANLAGAHITTLQFINAGNTTYLMATDQQGKQLYLFTTDLKEIAAFGYGSASTFSVADLFNRSQFMVITADSSGSISCFRIK